ncbi:MAG: MFS transporter [Thermoplasmatales archaeon]|nr:MFS transporter [Thermoplasmatales archaeon]MCW6170619.1 MFS transporter [Thermoplasmatales archaeon]
MLTEEHPSSTDNFGRKERIKALTFTSLGHFSNDLNLLLFSILIVYYSKDYGISLALLGGVAIVYNVLSGLLSAPIGSYADRTGGYRFLVAAGIAIIGASVVLFAFSFHFSHYVLPLMLVSAIVLGTGQAFYHPLGASVLRITYEAKTSSALGINGSFGSVGRSVLPVLLVPMIVLYGEFHTLLYLAGYLFIASLIIFFGLNFISPIKDTIERKFSKPSEDASDKGIERYEKAIFVLVLIVFVRAMFLTGTTTYISQYLVDRVHSDAVMSYIVTISFITAVVGQPVFGRITEIKGGKFSIIVTTIFSTIFFILFMLSGSNVIFDTLTYASFVFMAFTGFPVLLGYVGQIVPRSVVTKSSGLVWGLGNTVGGGVGLAVMSLLLFVRITLLDTMWLMLVFGVVSCILLPLLPRRIKS